jgi:prepilin peptidase CpaA
MSRDSTIQFGKRREMIGNSVYVYYAAHSILILLLLVAAAFDVWKLILPNMISIFVVAAFCAVAILLPSGQISWLSHLGAGAAVLVVGLLVFRFSFLGAGDIKLLTAIAVWAGFDHLLILLVCIGLAGGALAVAVLMMRKFLNSLTLYMPMSGTLAAVQVVCERTKLPYGLAIALGSIWVIYDLPPPGLLY